MEGSIELANLLTATLFLGREFFKTARAVIIFTVLAGKSLACGSLEYTILFVSGLMRIADCAVTGASFAQPTILKNKKDMTGIKKKRLSI